MRLTYLDIILGDQVKLRQILINLLNNVLKFTEEGEISVRAKRVINTETEPVRLDSPKILAGLHFEIEDTGSGIAPEEMDRLFEAFEQTETGRKAQEETGLGLPISRRFVQLMGGDMRARSQVGQGTVFEFDIQIQLISDTDMAGPKSRHQVIALELDQPRYRILIVDDKEMNR